MRRVRVSVLLLLAAAGLWFGGQALAGHGAGPGLGPATVLRVLAGVLAVAGLTLLVFGRIALPGVCSVDLRGDAPRLVLGAGFLSLAIAREPAAGWWIRIPASGLHLFASLWSRLLAKVLLSAAVLHPLGIRFGWPRAIGAAAACFVLLWLLEGAIHGALAPRPAAAPGGHRS